MLLTFWVRSYSFTLSIKIMPYVRDTLSIGWSNSLTLSLSSSNSFSIPRSLEWRLGISTSPYTKCSVLTSINFLNFDQNIECIGIHWVGYSKYQATKNWWSYHLVWMRKHAYRVSLKEFLKLFNCLASNGIHTISGWLDLLFKALHQERKRRNERILTRLT